MRQMRYLIYENKAVTIELVLGYVCTYRRKLSEEIKKMIDHVRYIEEEKYNRSYKDSAREII